MNKTRTTSVHHYWLSLTVFIPSFLVLYPLLPSIPINIITFITISDSSEVLCLDLCYCCCYTHWYCCYTHWCYCTTQKVHDFLILIFQSHYHHEQYNLFFVIFIHSTPWMLVLVLRYIFMFYLHELMFFYLLLLFSSSSSKRLFFKNFQ